MNPFFDNLRIDSVRLRVLNPEAVALFYRDIVGLAEIAREGRTVRLSSNGSEPAQIIVDGEPGAIPRKVTAPGLFHTAFLFPNRRELARTLQRIGERGWRFQGFADHGVSEAAYLADPEGNGVELYADRRRDEWPQGRDGISMVTEALDVPGLLAEGLAEGPRDNKGHSDVIIGHIHLQVSDLDRSAMFYQGILALDITQRNYPGALFLSSGGYHHHIGLNVWNSHGSQPAKDNSTGLMSFTLRIGSVDSVLERARSASMPIQAEDLKAGAVMDPDGLTVQLQQLPAVPIMP